ncbi:hypothetical protein OYC64_004110 [Pagothenia borchgrevinki]|uniref:C-type lectin domain-containing protein n=1 Tax=Pagothenia borchgrevinki TaxID=8213 RepID=A0ABD2FWF3_PAGBO
MQWIQFVLILMGQCSFFTCHLYEYHFIQEGKTWEEAQSYCREHFTDLATVSDMRDVERLTNSSQTTGAWIGLRSINERDIKVWHWSLPGGSTILQNVIQNVDLNGIQMSRTMQVSILRTV